MSVWKKIYDPWLLSVQGERIGEPRSVAIIGWRRAHLIGRGISLRKGDELRAS